MTSIQPPAPDEVLPEGLTSWNADEYVPLPDKAEVEFVSDGVTTKFGHDEFGGAVITMKWGDPHHRFMRLDTALEGPGLVELYNKIFKPLLDRDAEIARLAAAADAAYEAEQAQVVQEQRAHIAASAFRRQNLTSNKDRHRHYWRLHKHACPVLDRTGYRHSGDGPRTLDQLMTTDLSSIRDRYEKLLAEDAIAQNWRRRANRTAFDNTVMVLCGQCKPIGPQSKYVSDELQRLAHLVVHDPNAMVNAARLLLAIENGLKETDAAYREARDNLA